MKKDRLMNVIYLILVYFILFLIAGVYFLQLEVFRG